MSLQERTSRSGAAERPRATGRGSERPARTNLALGVLSLAAFVIGSAELLVVGVLDLIADDTGVSISSAGQLVTAYALGIAFGGPVLAALTGRFGRRSVLQGALLAFLVGNGLAIVVTSFGLLVLARVVTGSLHGLVAGAALAIAAGLVAPEHRGQAMAMVIGGITLATVVGVPLGTLIGQELGWEAAFVAIIVLGTVALAATTLFVPSVPSDGGGDLGAEARAAFAPRVLAVLALAVVVFAGQFTAFTYLTPFLQEVAGVSGGLVSVFLAAFGIAATVGTVLGGRAADRSATTTLLVAGGAVTAAIGALYLVGPSPTLVVVALVAWGFAGFAIPPALMLRAVTLAGSGGGHAAMLVVSATNAGIVAGSLIGGAVISAHGARATALAAFFVCATALPGIWASHALQAPEPSAEQRRDDKFGPEAAAAQLAAQGGA